MKNLLLLFVSLILISSCKKQETKSNNLVSTNDELYEAISNSKPGDNIVMANGEWNDLEIRFTIDGTKDNPITLNAETPGKVIIQGKSDIKIGADYINIDGLYFTNGFSPSIAVIEFAFEDVANHCKVSNCVIKDFNKLQRNQQDLWVRFKGTNNQLDHCYISGKSNKGPTVRVALNGNENINNYHKITNNHFGPRPPKGGPSAETIQIGDSYTSMCPSYTMVENNLFDRCNGEVEIISSKTNFNEFRANVFYKSEGSLVTRHGNYCTIDGNFFIGDDKSNQIGGIRLIGTGHKVMNNYFYNLHGENFRSPLAVMNGIRKSPLNRYIQVTDVIVAHNSWINCKSPLQFGVGSNISQKDVLPASEIRSEIPIRTVVANNLIYNEKGDKQPIFAHDKLDGIKFKSNYINNQGVAFEKNEGLTTKSFDLEKLDENIMIPTTDLSDLNLYSGFGFDKITKDVFGASRSENNSIGAVSTKPASTPNILDKSKYGPKWYDDASKFESKIHKVNNDKNLADIIGQASEGDIIELGLGDYEISSSLKINKTLTIRSNDINNRANLIYLGDPNTPLFEMNPKGQLKINDLNLIGDNNQFAFASLEKNMSSLYNLKVENCSIENFYSVLMAYKYSFSEHILFVSSTIKNCQNGLDLSQETEDKGEYNAENIIIDKCLFENVDENVINYYRGGYDESTVGGNLKVSSSTFTNCGKKEKNGILLKTYGIINVNISGNLFENNKIKLVALLWGAKNNTYSDNKIINSGKILVEENLKLNLLY